MENVRRPLSVAWIVTALLAVPAGCRKPGAHPAWDVDLLGPLFTTRLTLGNLVADSLLVTDANGNVTLRYTSSLFAVDLDTVLKAPDTTYFYPGSIGVPGPLNLPPGVSIVSEDQITRFDLGEVALRRLDLKEGTVQFRLVNMIPGTMIGTFGLPGATDASGTPLQISRSVGPGTRDHPRVELDSRDLAGYSFDLRGPGLNSTNTLRTMLGIQVDPTGQGVTVTGQDSVNIEVSYIGLKPRYARGYFGSQTIEVEPTETDLDLFQNVVAGTLDLDQVTLRVKVLNSLGMDIQARLHYLRATNSRSGTTVDLTHTILQGPINLARALDLGNGYVPTTYLNTLDNTNSNVDLFVESMPDKVAYAMEVRVNPLGDISSGHDFVYGDSQLRADLELEIPLRLIANELTLETIVDPGLQTPDGSQALQSGTLNIFATNGFPLEARLEMALIDRSDVLLGHIPVQGTVASGVYGPNGIVTASTASRLTAQLDPHQVHQLYQGARFRLRAVFNTADQSQHVQLLQHYRLDLQVTAGANVLVGP